MNKVYEGYFESEADGLEISAMAVLPQSGKYQAVIQLVHGMSEHKERYLPFMQYLADRGYVSVIHDHRGHGKSVREKKDLGYMYGGGAEALIQDIKTMNHMAHVHFPELPVRAFAAKYDSEIDMLIVCGSPSNNPARAMGSMLASVEKMICGATHRSRLLEKISFGSYDAKFKKDKSCTSWLCSEKAAVEAYHRSTLCGFTFTDDGYLTLFELMKRAYDWKKWNCTNKKMPILFIGGAEDPCIDGVRNFSKALQNIRHAGYVDVKGKLYPGMRHEILNEKEKEKVYHDIVVYLKKKGF